MRNVCLPSFIGAYRIVKYRNAYSIKYHIDEPQSSVRIEYLYSPYWADFRERKSAVTA